MNIENSELIHQALEAVIRELLIDSSKHPIVGANRTGAFPAASFGSLVTQTTFLVVPDTNYLLRDIANACRSGRRVLVSAANNGFLRLYCPPHVIEEVYEKAAETCERETRERGFIALHEFIARWEAEYLPLLRRVDDPEALIALLTPAERKRVDSLRIEDPDDIPAAVLAIVLNAFFLSWDQAPIRAVYGRTASQKELRDQVLALMDGGRVGKVSEMIALLLLIPASAFQALGEIFTWLDERAPWAPWLLAAAAVVVVLSLSKEQRSALGSFAGAVLTVIRELYQVYQEATQHLQLSCPGDPDWSELFVSVGGRCALIRAGLHTLARVPDGVSSAKSLANRLPDITVGQGEKLVREMLRSNSYFAKPYIGNWQVAYPVTSRGISGHRGGSVDAEAPE